jgi:pantoate--beta-alanine ligase
MEIYGEISKVRAAVKAWKKEGLTVGFVPTMGYLHEGHKSLIDAARKENDRVVVSIFVNPMQFGPTEDLESYPRDLKKDAALCEAAGVDIIFHPEPEEMYKDGFCSFVDMNGLTNALCGLSRPVHSRSQSIYKIGQCTSQRQPGVAQRLQLEKYSCRIYGFCPFWRCCILTHASST